MRLSIPAVLCLTLVGFALRLHYLTNSHPFFDEFTTVLAARQILRAGWPILPSGLFYEHGLLATYLAAPFTALFINTSPAEWQPAQWGLMPARWPSVLVSTATIPLIYRLAHHFYRSVTAAGPQQRVMKKVGGTPPTQKTGTGRSPGRRRAPAAAIGLLAAGLFALSPEGIVWGGRARMYALATLLVLLTVYWAYRGAVYPAPAKFRWLMLAGLLAALLTQLGALLLLPPLLAAMVALGWWTQRAAGSQARLWFWSARIIPELLALAGVIGLALLVKRLGQPLGAPALDNAASGALLLELAGTVAYQTTFHFTWPDTEQFLARQFGVAHHLWLSLIAIGGLLAALAARLFRPSSHPAAWPRLPLLPGNLFLILIFGLIILEMVTFLEPFRRNPRYIVMFLPLFYLIAATSVIYLLGLAAALFSRSDFKTKEVGFISVAEGGEVGATPRRPSGLRGFTTDLKLTQMKATLAQPLLALLALGVLAFIGWPDVRLALLTPEPAYEAAFAQVRSRWQPGDRLLTMNTPAAELYLGQVDGFTVQDQADQFLLAGQTGPVDRWLGAPWIGTAGDFSAALGQGPRVWFVIDTIRQPVYFRGDWLAVLERQMEPIWSGDNALVYRSRPDRPPQVTEPETRLDDAVTGPIRLVGYTVAQTQSEASNLALDVTLFWQPLEPLAIDYTTFLHVRNEAGVTVAQRDGQPLDGAYPTSQWQPGEIVIDSVSLSLPAELPAGPYTLLTGLYRLDTLERLPVANDVSGENALVLEQVTLP